VPTGALGERNRATALTCALPRSVRYEVHPSLQRGAVGSTVAGVTADLRVLLSAVLEPPLMDPLRAHLPHALTCTRRA
jgi:hypothetical protein